MGDPVSTPDTNGHRRGEMVPNGDKARKQLGFTRLMPSYLAKVAPTDNLPYVGGTGERHNNRPIRAFPIHKANVVSLVSSIWWHHDSANSCSSSI